MFRVRTNFTGVPGTPWISNFYFDESGGRDGTQALAATRAFWLAMQSRIANNIRVQVEPEVYRINPATGDTTDVATLSSAFFDGSGSGPMWPAATQGLIRWNTGLYRLGRQVVGHTFVPGLLQGSTGVDGNLITAAVTQLQTAATALTTTSTGGLLPGPVVYSRPRAGSFDPPLPPLPGLTAPITSFSVKGKPGVIRSRRD